MFSPAASSSRLSWLKTMVFVLLAALILKVLANILLEYRGYFPPDFNSPFLTGRRESFTPLYATAFYTHILSGPVALVLGTFLMATGGIARIGSWHRWAGRGLMFLIFFALVPSSLMMAPR